MPAHGKALIWGLGRFGGGLGALLHLHRRGYQLGIMDRQSPEELREALRDVVELDQLPDLLAEEPASLECFDLLVVNPAIPLDHPLLAAADRRGLAQTQELDLFLGAYPGRIHAVTGTNGKSTTASLMARRASPCSHSENDGWCVLGLPRQQTVGRDPLRFF